MTTNFPKPLDKQVAAISDSLLQTQDGLAIVANGNTHAAISSGQFVYVKNHDTLAEGLYKATSAIEANGTLSTSNLTPDGSGGLNDLQGQLTTLNSKLSNQTLTPSNYININPTFSINALQCIRFTPNLMMINYDIAGTINEGETVIGTVTSNVKNANYGAGRVSTSSGTYPTSIVVIGGGAIRIHSSKAGTASAGTVLVMISG